MSGLYQQALVELGEVFARLDEAEVDMAVDALAGANRIVCCGLGREGLLVRGLVMRLYHLGLHAAMVGDMTTPPVGPGDLLLVSAGSGSFPTVLALMGVAAEAGARTLVITAQDGEAARRADLLLRVPAQTMADDAGGASALPMGSLFEGALYLLFEVIVLHLRDKLGISTDAMRARHTNLE